MSTASDWARKQLKEHHQRIRTDREKQRSDPRHHAWLSTHDAATGRKTHDRAR